MRRLLAGVLCLVAPVCLRSQQALPSWLLTYPCAQSAAARTELAIMAGGLRRGGQPHPERYGPIQE